MLLLLRMHIEAAAPTPPLAIGEGGEVGFVIGRLTHILKYQ